MQGWEMTGEQPPAETSRWERGGGEGISKVLRAEQPCMRPGQLPLESGALGDTRLEMTFEIQTHACALTDIHDRNMH